MLRLMAYDEVIADKKLARTLIKGGLSGLHIGWKPDLGDDEVVPGVFGGKFKPIPLTTLPPGMYELLWEEDGSMEQLVLTDKAIFWGAEVYPRGTGISRVAPQALRGLQDYLTGSGIRLIAYGDDVDPNIREYNPIRSSDKIPGVYRGMVILGQVDLNTGDIWPLPKELGGTASR